MKNKILPLVLILSLFIFNSCYINVVNKVKEDIVYNYKFKLLKEPSSDDPTIELVLQKIPSYKKITYEKYDKFSHRNTSLVGSVLAFLAFSGVYGIWQQKEDPIYQNIFYLSAGVLAVNLLYFLFSEDLDKESIIKKSLENYEVIESFLDEKDKNNLIDVEKSKIDVTIISNQLNIKKQINDGRLKIDLLKDFGLEDFSRVELRIIYKKDLREFQDQLNCTKYIRIKRNGVRGFSLESSQEQPLYFNAGTKLSYLGLLRTNNEIYYNVRGYYPYSGEYAIKYNKDDFDVIFEVEIK